MAGSPEPFGSRLPAHALVPGAVRVDDEPDAVVPLGHAAPVGTEAAFLEEAVRVGLQVAPIGGVPHLGGEGAEVEGLHAGARVRAHTDMPPDLRVVERSIWMYLSIYILICQAYIK